MPANNEPPTANQTAQHAKPANRRYLKATLAGSAGGLVAVLIFLLEQRPELAQLLLERVLIAWGPQFVIVLILLAFLYVLADRYAPRLIAAQSETALALQNLARSVEQLASREDSFRREQDVLLNHVARRVDALHKLLESHHRALNGHLARLSRAHRATKSTPRPPSPPQARTIHRSAEPRGVALIPPLRDEGHLPRGGDPATRGRSDVRNRIPRRLSRKPHAQAKPRKRRRRLPPRSPSAPTGPSPGTRPRTAREPPPVGVTESMAPGTRPSQ